MSWRLIMVDDKEKITSVLDDRGCNFLNNMLLKISVGLYRLNKCSRE